MECRKIHCGATLISRNKALTAAHCDVQNRQYTHKIIVGHKKITASTIRNDITRVFTFPRYHTDIYTLPKFDLAIVQFNNNENQGVVPYGKLRRQRREDATMFVSGFKRISKDVVLVSRRVVITPTNVCATKYYKQLDKRNSVCADDRCVGVSGSALYDKQLNIVGVVSYGKGCEVPTVFVRVEMFITWIDAVMRKIDALPKKTNVTDMRT